MAIDIIRVMGVRKGTQWFACEPQQAPHLDVIHCLQLPAPLKGAWNQEFHTILIDLGKPTEELFQGMDKDTRYEVRRATEKDGLVHEHFVEVDGSVLERFISFHDRFALQKGLRSMGNAEMYRRYAANGELLLTMVRNSAGEELVWHAYYVGCGRARLLKSASLRLTDPGRKAYLGRANRFAHWKDIVFLKERGFQTCDFGGWYAGAVDREKIRINKFKKGFGGKIVTEYHAVKPMTWKGWVYVLGFVVREFWRKLLQVRPALRLRAGAN